MRENRAFGLLLLVSTAALVFALDSRDRDDPFPINPAIELRMNGTWRYGMDCKPLCAVLEAA